MMRASRALAVAVLIVGIGFFGAGCKKDEIKTFGTISGKVLKGGNPVPGGRITFSKGSETIIASFLSDGVYRAEVPVGDWQVAIDTQPAKDMEKAGGGDMPMPPTFSPDMVNKMKGGKFDPKSFDPKSLKSAYTGVKYVPIAEKYRDPQQSGLTATIQQGEQTRDFTVD